MARRQHGGDAGGVQDAVIGRVGGDDRRCLQVLGIPGEGRHGRAHLAAHLTRHLGEIAARDVAGFDGEFIFADLHQPLGQLVDGVLLHRAAGMAAGIGHFQDIVLGEFLRRLHRHDQRLALTVQTAAAAFVQRELRINQFALVLGQPARAVEGRGRFLAAGQRQLERAPVLEAFLLDAHQGIDPGGVQRLHVGDAAAIEIAILFNQGEGIARPVLALGFHHIEMSQQQDGLGLGIAAGQHRDNAAFLGLVRRRKQMDVAVGEARVLQVAGDLARQFGAAAIRQRGFGLHHFLEQRAVAGMGVLGKSRGGNGGKCHGGCQQRSDQGAKHGNLQTTDAVRWYSPAPESSELCRYFTPA